jgi:hypothetical protein
MLSVYTRHYPPCAQSDPYYRRCHCPKWIMGTVETTGAFLRLSARTRAWEKAEKKARLQASRFTFTAIGFSLIADR